MNKILVSPSPHIHAKTSTTVLMRDVVIALLPSVIVSVLYYGLSALLLLAVSVVSCLLAEYLITRFMFKAPSTVGDWSSSVTGVLLFLNLPPSCPWWVAVIGSVFAIGVVKMTFGGLGQNLFNPAIAARVFLLVSFPTFMTNWAAPKGFIGGVDAVSGATPLGIVKEGLAQGMTLPEIYAQHDFSYLQTLFINIGGSAGEISAIAILVGFIYLLARKVIRPYITLSILATVFVFSGIFWLINPDQYTDPLFNLLTGGVLLGAVFMATDYVTSPMSDKGGIIFGVGIGCRLSTSSANKRNTGGNDMAVKSSFKNMVLCLLVICLVSSALLAVVYAVTKAPIDAAAAAKTNNAIAQVVPEFDGTPELAEISVAGTDYTYYKVSKGGSVAGYAIIASGSGFSGPVTLMVGLTSDGIVYNTTVLSQAETPGLGAKCTEPAFADQFRNFNPEEKVLKVKKDGGDVDAITASTITSRAYVAAIQNALNVFAAITTGAQPDAASGASTLHATMEYENTSETDNGGQSNE